jgi:[acyl-carrier-protein] S-malonyltransferase
MNKIAYIFPGQGSQGIGMGQDMYDNFDISKEMVANASDRLGLDFTKLLFEENSDLEKTEYTQPAILLVSSIANAIFKQECDITPSFVLGHSLGEFSALVSVGAVDVIDAVELVHLRGKYMSEACEGGNAGMMALIGLADEKAEAIALEARDSGKRVWPANYNSDGQLVMAGIKDDLSSLEATFKEAGAKRALLLNMSVASHCPLLEEASVRLQEKLEVMIKDEFIAPIVSNVTAKTYSTKAEAIDLLVKQLTSAVLYKQSIANYADSVDCMIEFGHGNVLKGLNKRATKTPVYNVNSKDSLIATLENLK